MGELALQLLQIELVPAVDHPVGSKCYTCTLGDLGYRSFLLLAGCPLVLEALDSSTAFDRCTGYLGLGLKSKNHQK